jgi:hypothetical protein
MQNNSVRIIPIRLICDWKPTGWLGIAIAGRKWIDFRDIETNIDKIDQLILEIKNLVGQQMDCFNEIEPGNFDQNQQEAYVLLPQVSIKIQKKRIFHMQSVH